MARRRRKGQTDVLNNTSFLDVMSNTVGALAFVLLLIVLVAIAVKLNYRPLKIESPKQLPDAIVSVEYRIALAGVGGNEPYRWWMEEEQQHNLPPGLRFAEAEEGVTYDDGVRRRHVSGLITGKPEAAGEAKFEVWLDDTPVSDNEGQVVSDKKPSKKTFLLRVQEKPIPVPPLTIRTRELPKACIGQSYAVTLAATGGVPPYRWSLMEKPDWIELQDDTLTGVPGTVGGSPIRFMVKDSRGAEVSADSMELAAGGCLGWCCPPPPDELTILTRLLPDAIANRKYDLALAATGGIAPYRWSLSRGSELPEGLRLTKQGSIAGQPKGQIQEHEVWVMVENAPSASVEGRSERKLVLTVLPEPAEAEPLRIF